MIYAFYLIYIWTIILAVRYRELAGQEGKERGLATVCLAIPFVAVIWTNIVFSNQVYLKKALIDEATASLMTRIVADIEEADGYQPGETPVAFVGSFERSSAVGELVGFEEIKPYGMGRSNLSYEGLDYAYLETVLNVNMNLTRIAVADEQTLEMISDMPEYPASGSIVYMDDTLVVKISDLLR